MNEKFLSLLNNDANLYPIKLEQEYPHIFSKLVDLWETSQLKEYLDEVVFDERGNRAGFNNEVGNELWKLHLHRLNTEATGGENKTKDYWDWIRQQYFKKPALAGFVLSIIPVIITGCVVLWLKRMTIIK